MSDFTHNDLANLKKAYSRGVLKVREGDTWVEYQSMKQMADAIDRIEAELGIQRASRPRGVQRVRFGKMR